MIDMRKLLMPALVLLAFALRVWRIDIVHFQIDESIAAAVASQIGHLRRFPLTGIETSFGFHNPPLYLYVLAPVFAIFRDPRAAMAMIAFIGSLAILPAWRAGRLAGGPAAAWIAAILFAVCPNAIEYSRRLWGHDMIVPLGAVAYWGAFEARECASWRLVALSFAAAAAAQCIHLSGILFWVPGLAVLFAERKIIKRLYAAIVGLGVLLLMYIPWFVNELREGFHDIRIVLGQLSTGAAQRDLGIAVHPLGAWTMVLGDFWNNDLLGHLRPWMVSRGALLAEPFTSLLAFAFLAGGLAWAALELRRGERTVPLALLLGIVLPAVAFGVILTASVPPYLLPALIPALLAAACWLSRLKPSIVYTLLTVYTIASITLTISVRAAIARGAGTGIPLAERMNAIALIEGLAGGEPFFVMQDARSISTGLDISYVYLMYARDMSDLARAAPGAGENFFVIVDEHTRMRPEPAVFLRGTGTPFVSRRLRVYTISADRMEDWLEVLRRYPASGK